MVDDTAISIRSNTMIAPNVTIVAGTHPLEPELRKQGIRYNLPVSSGKILLDWRKCHYFTWHYHL